MINRGKRSKALSEVNQVEKPVSQGPRMSQEFASMKDSQSIKFKRRPQIFKKLSFRELCDSNLSGLHPFDNMTRIY